jgi:DNA mismatch repair protein MutS2
MLADARRAADDLLSRAEREVDDVRREVTRQRNLRGARASGSPAQKALEELAGRTARARSDAAARGDGEATSQAEDAAQPRAGLWGRSRTLGTAGRILEVSGRTGRVTLETEGARIVVPGEDVEVVDEPVRGPTPRDTEMAELRQRAAGRIAPRLDLRGERVEAAIEQLGAYLDEALLAGLDEAVVVHGAGTGALRRAIREFLAEHPRVRSTRPGRREEGGDGATVAAL